MIETERDLRYKLSNDILRLDNISDKLKREVVDAWVVKGWARIKDGKLYLVKK